MNVKDFYDSVGWRRAWNGFIDANLNENLRASAREYTSRIRSRLANYFPEVGNCFLDIGSGPIQYPEYEKLSSGFLERHCVDLSVVALEEAKAKFGQHIHTHNIDFLDFEINKEFDVAVAINCLYHVESAKQEEFVLRMMKFLSRDGVAIIVYSNPRSLSGMITHGLVSTKRLLSMFKRSRKIENPIYFKRHKKKFWKRFQNSYELELFPWRTLNPALEAKLIPNNKFGESFFRLLSVIEDRKWWHIFCEYYVVLLKHKN